MKGNQGLCHEEVKSFLIDAVARHGQTAPARKNKMPLAYKETVEKNHGRLENASLLAEWRFGLVCRSQVVGRIA